MKKLIAITLCLLMVLSSLAYVSMDTEAEDSTRPFVDMSTGYPIATTILDQQQTALGGSYTISGPNWALQTFRPSMDGNIIQVMINGMKVGGTGALIIEIWDTDQVGGPTGMLTTEAFPDVSIPGAQAWFTIDLSTPVALSTGTEYAIMMFSGTLTVQAFTMGTNPYPPGAGFSSNNGGGSWMPLAGDGDFAFVTYMQNPNSGLSKIAWHSNGEYAVAVTGFNDEAWKFTRETGAWTSLGNIYGGATFSDIVFDDFSGRFYLSCWKSANTPLVIYYDGSTFWDAGIPGAAYTHLLGIETCGGVNGYHILVTGEDGSDGYAAWYDGSWTEIKGLAGGWVGGEVGLAEDAAWNQRTNPVTSKHYIVGHDDQGTGFVYELDAPGDTTVTRLYATYDDDIDWMNVISWCPRWADGPEYDYAIMAGMNNEGWSNIWKFDGVNKPEGILTSFDTFYDVDWTTDGSMAVIVGEDTGHKGRVFHHGAGTDLLADMSGDLPQGTGPLFGIAYKGYTSPSSGIIVGASSGMATYPSASDSLTTITVNAAFPHMYTIDMWKTSDGGQTSTLNKGVDVETTYTFYTEINYTVTGTDKLFDGINNTFVDLLIWYDEGTEAGTPTPDDTHRTRYCVARWYETPNLLPSSVTGRILYPSAVADEFVLDSVGCSGPFGVDDRYAVWMNISFGSQIRAAYGGGFANGASTDIYDTAQSQNDIDSWNIAYTVFDNDFAGALNITYEEFGVNKLSNVTVSGNPSGNAPPGMNDNFLGNSQITLSSNVPYYVNVSLPNLTSGSDEIEATNVAISLVGAYPAGFDYEPYTEINATWGAFGRAFSAANSPMMIWGNASRAPANQLIVAPDNGTTAHGPWGSDFNGFAETQISWWASIPASTAEGVYTATITFEIGEY